MQEELQPFQVYGKNRGHQNCCSICKKDFKKLINSEHQCKRCKRPICDQCGKNKVRIINYFDNKPHRICCICYQDHSFIMKTIKNNKLKFAQDSKITKQWVLALGIKENIQQMTQNYQYYLQDFKNQCPQADFKPYFKFQNTSQILLGQFEASLNYSFYEFYHYTSYENDIKQGNILKSIEDLTGALILKNPQLGFVPEFIQFVAFILCFNSEETAFSIIDRIILTIYPESLYPRNIQDPLFDSRNQKKRFATITNAIAQLAKPEVFLITKFLDMYLNVLFPNLAINIFNFQVSFFLFENVIKDKDFIKIELALVSSITKQLSQIKNPDNNFFITHFNIVREYSYQSLKESISRYEFKNIELEPRALNKIEIDTDKKKYDNQVQKSEKYKKAITKVIKVSNQNEELQEEKRQQEQLVKNLAFQIQNLKEDNEQILEQNKQQQQEIIRLNSLLNTNDQIQKTELKLNDQQEIISSQEILLSEYKSLIDQLKQKINILQDQNIQLQIFNEKKINYNQNKMEKMETNITSADDIENMINNIGDQNNITQISDIPQDQINNSQISNNDYNNTYNYSQEYFALKKEYNQLEQDLLDQNLRFKDLKAENDRLIKSNITLKNQSVEIQNKNQESLNILQNFLDEKDSKIQQLKMVIQDHECLINELKNEEVLKDEHIQGLEIQIQNMQQTVNKMMDDEVDIFKIQSIQIDLEEALEELLENFDVEENIETVLQMIKEIYYSCEYQKIDNQIKKELIQQLNQKYSKTQQENQKYNAQLQQLTKILDEKMDLCEEQNNVIEDLKFKINQQNFSNSNSKIRQSYNNIF